jgi:O-antigen/teichoic acid export membrane protein
MIRSVYHKGFFHLLSVNFLTQFLGFGTTLLVAKLLSPVELGEIKILQSYSGLFVVLGGFGINTAVLKICSEKHDEQYKGHILRYALVRSMLCATIALGLIVLLTLTGVITSSRRLSLWLVVYSLIVPFAVVSEILTVFIQALKKIKEMARAQAVIKVQSFILIVMCTWLWGFRGFVLATISAYIVGVVPLLRQVGLKYLSTVAGGVTGIPKLFSHIALFSMLANGVGLIGRYADIFILDHFVSNRAEIGYYSLATIFVLGATQVTNTVQSIATPYFSEHAGEEMWFRRQVVINQTRMAALSVMVAVLSYGVAFFFVPYFYGPAYHSTLVYLAILLIRYVVWSSYAILGVAVVGLGLVRLNFVASIICTSINLSLTYLLLQRFGIVGVAWAQTVSAGIYFFVCIVVIQMALRHTFGRGHKDSAQARVPQTASLRPYEKFKEREG